MNKNKIIFVFLISLLVYGMVVYGCTSNIISKKDANFSEDANNIEIENNESNTTSAEESEIKMENNINATLRQKALEYLKTKPNPVSKKNYTWDEYFENSYLKTKLDYDWFENHSSIILTTPLPGYEGGINNETYYVIWNGLPGCEQDPTKPSSTDSGPNWFDKEGNQCYLIWEVVVYIDKNLSPEKVVMHDVGGVA